MYEITLPISHRGNLWTPEMTYTICDKMAEALADYIILSLMYNNKRIKLISCVSNISVRKKGEGWGKLDGAV